MNSNECGELADSYLNWLRNEVTAQQVGAKSIEFTTPFLDHHNDHLLVTGTKHGERYTLSDDGEIIADLVSSGVDLKSFQRRQALDTILRGFGVSENNGALTIEASPAEFGQKMHSLIQAMLAADDLHFLARTRVASVFFEDVQSFLESSSVRYFSRVKLSGKSGYDHTVDFAIPAFRSQPERLVQAIATPNKNQISNYLFQVQDIRAARSEQIKPYALVNDANEKHFAASLAALNNYGIHAVGWSDRASVVEELAA